MANIVDLWNEEKLPIRDGIYFPNCRAIALSISTDRHRSIEKGPEFSVADFMEEHPEEVTHIDAMQKVPIGGKGWCLVGEGSLGSEGFIAYLTPDGSLEWVMYFENSNPFTSATRLSDEIIEVRSSAGYRIIIDAAMIRLWNAGTCMCAPQP